MQVANNLDFEWTSDIRNAILRPYTAMELEALRIQFTTENNPRKDGAFAYSEGVIKIWSHAAKQWQSANGTTNWTLTEW